MLYTSSLLSEDMAHHCVFVCAFPNQCLNKKDNILSTQNVLRMCCRLLENTLSILSTITISLSQYYHFINLSNASDVYLRLSVTISATDAWPHQRNSKTHGISSSRLSSLLQLKCMGKTCSKSLNAILFSSLQSCCQICLYLVALWHGI